MCVLWLLADKSLQQPAACAFLPRHGRCRSVVPASRPINALQTQAYWVTFARQSFTADHRSRYSTVMDEVKEPSPPSSSSLPPSLSSRWSHANQRGEPDIYGNSCFVLCRASWLPPLALFVFVLGKEVSVFITWWWIWRRCDWWRQVRRNRIGVTSENRESIVAALYDDWLLFSKKHCSKNRISQIFIANRMQLRLLHIR